MVLVASDTRRLHQQPPPVLTLLERKKSVESSSSILEGFNSCRRSFVPARPEPASIRGKRTPAMETPSTRRKGLRRHRSLQRRRPLLLKSSDETHTLSLCGRTFQRSAPPFIPSQASHSIPFDQNSLVLKPTAKVRRDPRANVLKLNAARMQGIPVAGALVVRNAEERPTASSHLVSAATTADPPSLAPLVAAATMSLAPSASMAGTSSMTSAATTSLAPSASVSNQLGALKRRGKGPWQLTWYACPHSAAVVSLSIAVFRQTMLQNHPFDTRNLDTISLESYQSAVSSLKDSADKG